MNAPDRYVTFSVATLFPGARFSRSAHQDAGQRP